ncbi:MAG: 3-oxoacyl-[acyl-carrier-protein] reductase [Chloroflexi bacterium]|jgi:3-oxoacyl-[acyl-carrier protein] reductase|nr:3-oxoacyl-[acyl-carrier-protein] reductase [Chloroflexota bacterium]
MQPDLTNRVALVTGASRGIGRAIALALAAAGARVVINYRDRGDAAEQVAATIREAGGRADVLQADVADRESVDALIRQIMTLAGGLDILVNNAGITRDGLLMRMKDDDFDAVLDTNLRGAFLCTRAALRPLLKSAHGRIINISSVVGVAGNAGQANYAAAKAGLLGFTRSVAREVASRQVTVNAVAPGFIDTDMTAVLGEAARSAALESIPLKRYGSAAEVAAVVCFLASDAAAYITGQTIAVDGGMVMS